MERLRSAKKTRQRAAHFVGLRKSAHGERRVYVTLPLHPPTGVEDRFAVARDEDTSVKLHERSNALKLSTSQALRGAAILFMKGTGIARFRRYIANSLYIKRKPQGSMV